MKITLPMAVLLATFGPAVPCLAQSMPMPGMQHEAQKESPSTRAYRDAMAKMHREMEIPYTGNSDRDFVAGMIPHHQGAIDMAKVELRYGKDPVLKRLARDIVQAQDDEIAFMRRWQAEHAH